MTRPWTRPDIIRSFRWRLALYWLGLTGVAAGIVVIIWLAIAHDVDTAFALGMPVVIVASLLMIPASRCLNCGFKLRYALGLRGIECYYCGAVHAEALGRSSGNVSLKFARHNSEFPSLMRTCWLHPPMVRRFTLYSNLAKWGIALAALAGVAFLVLLALLSGIISSSVTPGTLLWVIGVSFAGALATNAGASRCPHCRKGFAELRAWRTNHLATWCGRCGAVLKATSHGRAAFEVAGKVVDEPPERND